MLAARPSRCAEEWAIHDYEGFGALRLSEWESFERVSAIAAGIAEHGDAFSAWLSYDSSLDPTDTQSRSRTRTAASGIRCARTPRTTRTTIGLYDAAEKSGSSYVTVDIDALERDLDIELYTVPSDHDTVYVFDPNA